MAFIRSAQSWNNQPTHNRHCELLDNQEARQLTLTAPTRGKIRALRLRSEHASESGASSRCPMNFEVVVCKAAFSVQLLSGPQVLWDNRSARIAIIPDLA